MAEATSRGARRRPLSPHLQVYSTEINMLMSIVHRITGAALYFGTVLLAWWLIAASAGPSYFNFVNGLFATPIGMAILLGYTWALLHHMLGGIRHLYWDTGRGLDLESVDRMCWTTLACSIGLTIIVWYFGLRLKGVL